MSTKIKILIGILVSIIVIGICGKYWFHERRIVITTDKAEYEKGEMVKILLKSDPLRSIYSPNWVESNLDIPGCAILPSNKEEWSFVFTPYKLKEWPIIKESEISPQKILTNDVKFFKEGTYKLFCTFRTQKYWCWFGIGADCMITNPFNNTLNFSSSEFRIKENWKDKIDEWEIYRNEKYGFEFRYPKELGIIREKEVNLGGEKMTTLELTPRLSLSIEENSRGLNLSEYIDKWFKEREKESFTFSPHLTTGTGPKRNISIGGKEAVKVFYLWKDRNFGVETFLLDKGRIYRFSFRDKNFQYFFTEGLHEFSIYEQILPSFKFIE